MKKIKILIDARRKINSGVGRVSQWIVNNIPTLSSDFDCYYLVGNNSSQRDYKIDNKKSYHTDILPFSAKEFDELPSLVNSTECQLYISPQTTWSPLHTVPSISMIHDLWAINNPEWLPSYKDMKSRFELTDLEYFEKLNSWFTTKMQNQILTKIGLEKYDYANSSSNIIWKGAWAQYSAMVELSSHVVTVSPFIKKEIDILFNSSHRVTPIPNVAGGFSTFANNNRKLLLTLSKLERRKNLDYLIDAYIIYADKETNGALPLVIAGDPGYEGVANLLKQKIQQLNIQGYDINLMPSVSDKELKNLFSNAACLIFPSHYEGFGLPALEGMLSMVPVIARETGMMSTKLGDFAIKVDGYNPASLAYKIQKVVKAPPNMEILLEAKKSVNQYIKTTNSKLYWKQIIDSITQSKK